MGLMGDHEPMGPLRVADPSDRATLEEQANVDECLARVKARAVRSSAAPREDGDCACGCGNPVDPRRIALGYGLTLECAERRERVLR